ncbi:MAG: hypothetical protein GY765_24535 [bacterium]|nr:hypothetical protein [bacterium]
MVQKLNVPYNDREEVKALGARWNPYQKLWYVPEDVNLKPFGKWIPEDDYGSCVRALAPIYLLESTAPCWKCEQNIPVITLASNGIRDTREDFVIEGLVLFSYVVSLPGKLRKFLAKRFPFFRKAYSQTTNSHYFINHCPCGAIQGDFDMHGEPGGAFCPTQESECEKMVLTLLKDDGFMLIHAEINQCSDDLILRVSRHQSLEELKKRPLPPGTG